MRKVALVTTLLISSTVAAAGAFAQQKIQAPTGYWLTENKRSVVELYQCPGKPEMCGKIHWIIKDGMQFDVKNPDSSLHSRPMCGLTILSGLKMDSSGNWHGGKVYKADEGDTYDAKMTVLSSDKVEMRGFMGISMFGKSQTWTRVSAKDYPRCAKPAK
jgi:uncharacterized protein (DUF2147 family)